MKHKYWKGNQSGCVYPNEEEEETQEKQSELNALIWLCKPKTMECIENNLPLLLPYQKDLFAYMQCSERKERIPLRQWIYE